MPSRQLLPSQPSTSPLPPPPHHHHHHLLTPVLAAAAAASASVFSLLLLAALLCRRTRKRTAPFSLENNNPPHRFSYSLLRHATNSFSIPLGHGGSGTVYSGTLSTKPIAVKLMDSNEREFHNELFFASRLHCSSPPPQNVVVAIGFSSDPKRRRFALVYNLMQNGNLQDALLRRKCPELFDWKKRFAVALDIAKGLNYLHSSCDPPVIHGDIKPSNVLLDRDFSARIGDFGLARLKSEPPPVELELLECNRGDSDGEDKKKEELVVVDDCGSMESVHIGFFEEGNLGVSPEETVEMAVEAAVEEEVSPGFDKRNGKGMKSNSVRELWWKQDSEDVVGGEGKKVKDYVMEWIGREVKRERPKSEWVGVSLGKEEKKKRRKQQLEWWESMDEEKVGGVVRKEKRRTVREWWKEEYCEEVAKREKKKKKKKKGLESDDDWWVSDDALYEDRKKVNKSRSRNRNRGGVDWWIDEFSGELWRARRNNSFDSASGEIPKSGGVSSTPSMRGTVCYVAPEYGYGEDVSEKCDVYSFGVLLLVIVSGRRPLQVTGSPLSEFQRANLLSWARHCARNGKLIELVDESIQSLDEEQAILCIKVALFCLLKSPAQRPSMEEVVGMLSGELEPPQLPVEYSPSTPSRFPFKSRKKKPVS